MLLSDSMKSKNSAAITLGRPLSNASICSGLQHVDETIRGQSVVTYYLYSYLIQFVVDINMRSCIRNYCLYYHQNYCYWNTAFIYWIIRIAWHNPFCISYGWRRISRRYCRIECWYRGEFGFYCIPKFIQFNRHYPLIRYSKPWFSCFR